MQTHFSICDTISTAWHRVKGSKSSFWSAIAIIWLIMFALGIVATLFSFFSHPLFQLTNAVSAIVNILLQVGLVYMGIQRANDLPITHAMVWHPFKLKLLIQIILLIFLLLILFLPPILISIAANSHINWLAALFLHLIASLLYVYIYLRSFLALGYVIDQGMNPVDAIMASFKNTRHHLWALLLITLINFIIIGISIIPLFIGLIWTIPYMIICYGVIYKKLARPSV